MNNGLSAGNPAINDEKQAEKLLHIANIQHFSVGDGDGIRTTVFFKGCNLHCPWCHNPETVSPDETVLRYPGQTRTERCGRRMRAEEVLAELLEDRDYYEESGGGVTFSGGEVLLQADAAASLAAKLRAEGISLFVDTAGCVGYEAFERLNPYTDVYLYDFKTASEEDCARVVGGSLARIRDNLARLLADGKRVRVRIPLIPGFNTSDAASDAIIRELAALGVTAVELLPFHRMGSGKYEAMGLPYAYRDTEPLQKAEAGRIAARYARAFTVKTEG